MGEGGFRVGSSLPDPPVLPLLTRSTLPPQGVSTGCGLLPTCGRMPRVGFAGEFPRKMSPWDHVWIMDPAACGRGFDLTWDVGPGGPFRHVMASQWGVCPQGKSALGRGGCGETDRCPQHPRKWKQEVSSRRGEPWRGGGNGTALLLGGRPDTPGVSGQGWAYEGGRAPRAAHFSPGP